MSAELCSLADIPAGNGLAIDVSGTGRVLLFRTPAGIRAYLDACPHLGRSLEFAPGEFLLGEQGDLVCPHHGATFALDSGACRSGPCQGGSLTPVAVRLLGDRILLGTAF